MLDFIQNLLFLFLGELNYLLRLLSDQRLLSDFCFFLSSCSDIFFGIDGKPFKFLNELQSLRVGLGFFPIVACSFDCSYLSLHLVIANRLIKDIDDLRRNPDVDSY